MNAVHTSFLWRRNSQASERLPLRMPNSDFNHYLTIIYCWIGNSMQSRLTLLLLSATISIVNISSWCFADDLECSKFVEDHIRRMALQSSDRDVIEDFSTKYEADLRHLDVSFPNVARSVRAHGKTRVTVSRNEWDNFEKARNQIRVRYSMTAGTDFLLGKNQPIDKIWKIGPSLNPPLRGYYERGKLRALEQHFQNPEIVTVATIEPGSCKVINLTVLGRRDRGKSITFEQLLTLDNKLCKDATLANEKSPELPYLTILGLCHSFGGNWAEIRSRQTESQGTGAGAMSAE
jgi:hypothetical protein